MQHRGGGDVSAPLLLLQNSMRRANCKVQQRQYNKLSSLRITSCMLAEDTSFYYHIFSFKPTILKMISDMIAAYTLCGDMQPPPIANTVFEEDEKLSLSRDGNISRRTF